VSGGADGAVETRDISLTRGQLPRAKDVPRAREAHDEEAAGGRVAALGAAAAAGAAVAAAAGGARDAVPIGRLHELLVERLRAQSLQSSSLETSTQAPALPPADASSMPAAGVTDPAAAAPRSTAAPAARSTAGTAELAQPLRALAASLGLPCSPALPPSRAAGAASAGAAGEVVLRSSLVEDARGEEGAWVKGPHAEDRRPSSAQDRSGASERSGAGAVGRYTLHPTP
ncbi:hypothetical protein T484DRAFT_1791216, partial [Baffinella frigidus]